MPSLRAAAALAVTLVAVEVLSGCVDEPREADAGRAWHSDAGGAPSTSPDAGTAAEDAGASTSHDAGPPEPDAGPAPSPDAGPDAGPPLVPGTLDVTWIHGAPDCGTSSDPPLQVHAYNDDTFILRQSKCVNFEGPFLYLLIGETRALLLDTGATSSSSLFPLRDTVEALLVEHLDGAPRASLELVVAHSHGHGDHVAGDGQLEGQPYTTVVGTSRADVESFFGIGNWPNDAVTYDLGGRVVDVLPIPGHQTSHIALYDRDTGLLLTGDSLYPGHLFISEWNTYRASIGRLADFASDVPVSWVLGTHVEMTDTAGVAYPYGTTYQPDEHPLELTRDHLLELDAALQVLGSAPSEQVHDDFIIAP